MINMLVFFGGTSVEHEVSIITAIQAINVIKKLHGYKVVPIYIAKTGIWYTGDHLTDIDNYKDIPKVIAQADEVFLVPSHQKNTAKLKFLSTKKSDIDIHIAFPIVHGTGGEDGTLAGLFELLNIPYIGCSPISAAISMDKVLQKEVLKDTDIPMAKSLWIYTEDYKDQKQKHRFISEIHSTLSFPLIVKPSNVGSSVGVSSVDIESELETAIEHAMSFSDKVIVENKVQNIKEINISVLGNPEIQLLSVCESPLSENKFLTYEDKYMSSSSTKGMSASKREIPADITPELVAQISEYAKTAFKTIGCSGVTRIDFLYDQVAKIPYLCELNTVPGSLSFYLWESTGITFEKEIQTLIEIAHRNHRNKNNLTRSNNTNLLSKKDLLGVKK